jgi:hypothetical protein
MPMRTGTAKKPHVLGVDAAGISPGSDSNAA